MKISIAKAKNILDTYNTETTVLSLHKTDGTTELLLPLGENVWQLKKGDEKPVVMTSHKTLNYLSSQDFDELKAYYEVLGVKKESIVVDSSIMVGRSLLLDSVKEEASKLAKKLPWTFEIKKRGK